MDLPMVSIEIIAHGVYLEAMIHTVYQTHLIPKHIKLMKFLTAKYFE